MKTITDILATQTLKHYVDKANTLRELNFLWCLVMKTDWAPQCQVACFEHGELVLHAPNAAVATRVRYDAPEIMKALSQHAIFATIQSIVCKVRAPLKTPETFPSKIKSSPRTAKLIQETADCLLHPILKKSLSTLAASMRRGVTA